MRRCPGSVSACVAFQAEHSLLGTAVGRVQILQSVKTAVVCTAQRFVRHAAHKSAHKQLWLLGDKTTSLAT